MRLGICSSPKHAKVVKSQCTLLCRRLHPRQRWEDYHETIAPLAKYALIRSVISLLAGRNRAKLYRMDVLHFCSYMKEEAYVEQPEGFGCFNFQQLVYLQYCGWKLQTGMFVHHMPLGK